MQRVSDPNHYRQSPTGFIIQGSDKHFAVIEIYYFYEQLNAKLHNESISLAMAV